MSDNLPVYTVADVEAQGRVEFEHFTKEDALELGIVSARVIEELGRNLAVDIVVRGDLIFRAKLAETGPGNDPWLAGKAAVAVHFGEASLLVKLRQEAAGVPFGDLDLDHSVMKAHGGSLPIYVGGELIGTITMSGEPDVVDHETVVEAVRRYQATLS
ncbi:MAG TPA: heme-binding protein [Galbitalea sp.]|jgi:uncharacterized protein (UPF0303 family)